MSKKDAAEMLISSVYLLGDGEDLKANLEKVINPSLSNFTKEQATSAVSLLNNISTIDSSGGEIKREFVGNVNNILNKPFQPKGKWD
jgi:hypothetical protein